MKYDGADILAALDKNQFQPFDAKATATTVARVRTSIENLLANLGEVVHDEDATRLREASSALGRLGAALKHAKEIKAREDARLETREKEARRLAAAWLKSLPAGDQLLVCLLVESPHGEFTELVREDIRSLSADKIQLEMHNHLSDIARWMACNIAGANGTVAEALLRETQRCAKVFRGDWPSLLRSVDLVGAVMHVERALGGGSQALANWRAQQCPTDGLADAPATNRRAL